MKTLTILILIFSVSFLGVNLVLVNQYANVEVQESEEEKEVLEEDGTLLERLGITTLLSAIFYPSAYANYEGPSLPTLIRPPKFST